jgi:hypothetical protein
MNHDMLPQNDEGLMAPAAAPSAEFINAISDFLNTDPSDLLLELGYYTREADNRSEAALAEANQ